MRCIRRTIEWFVNVGLRFAAPTCENCIFLPQSLPPIPFRCRHCRVGASRQNPLLPAALPGNRAPMHSPPAAKTGNWTYTSERRTGPGRCWKRPSLNAHAIVGAGGRPLALRAALCRSANAAMLAASSACAWQMPCGAVSEPGRRCVAGAVGSTSNRQHLERHSLRTICSEPIIRAARSVF